MSESRVTIKEDKKPTSIVKQQGYLALQLQIFQPKLVQSEDAPKRAVKAALEEIVRKSSALPIERITKYEKKLAAQGRKLKEQFIPLLRTALLEFLQKETRPTNPDEENLQNYEAVYNTLLNLALLAPLNTPIKNSRRRIMTSDGYQFDGVELRETFNSTSKVSYATVDSILNAGSFREKLSELGRYLSRTPHTATQQTTAFINPFNQKLFSKRDIEKIKSFKTPLEAALAEKAKIKKENREIWSHPSMVIALSIFIGSLSLMTCSIVFDSPWLFAIGGMIFLYSSGITGVLVKNGCRYTRFRTPEIDELIREETEAERQEEVRVKRLEQTEKNPMRESISEIAAPENKQVVIHLPSSISSARFAKLQRMGFSAELKEPLLGSTSGEDSEVTFPEFEIDLDGNIHTESKEQIPRLGL